MVMCFCDVLSKKKKGLVFIILGKKDSKLSIFVSFVKIINCTKSIILGCKKAAHFFEVIKFIYKVIFIKMRRNRILILFTNLFGNLLLEKSW
jgi:hypothetical protein